MSWRQDAEISARDFAAADEALHDVARHVDGHGKSDALVAADCWLIMAVLMPTSRPSASTSAPPELPGLMAASVWMKSWYWLNPVRPLRPSALTMPIVTVWPQAERIADGENDVADFQLVAVGERDGGQIFGVNFQNRHVRRRIGADDFGGVFRFVFPDGDLDFVRAVHDVVGRQNIAVRRNDDSRAKTLFPARAFPVVVRELVAEKLPEKRIVKKRIAHQPFMHDARGINVHDARRGLFDDGREAGAEFGVAVDGRGLNLECRRGFLAPRGEVKDDNHDQRARNRRQKSDQ